MKSFNDDRIRFFQNRNDGIIAVNRNYGINKSNGEFIAFCDDDDLWIKNKLEDQFENITKYNADMVYSICKLFGQINFFSNFFGIFPSPNRVKISQDSLLKYNTVPLCTVMVKKEVLDEFNGFNTQKKYSGIEDYELWLRLFKSKSIMFIPRIHAYYRIHPNMTQLQNASNDIGIRELHNKYKSNHKYKSFNNSRSKQVNFLRNIHYIFIEALIKLKIFNLRIFRQNFIKS